MSISGGPTIITNGLVADFDPATYKSYPISVTPSYYTHSFVTSNYTQNILRLTKSLRNGYIVICHAGTPYGDRGTASFNNISASLISSSDSAGRYINVYGMAVGDLGTGSYTSSVSASMYYGGETHVVIAFNDVDQNNPIRDFKSTNLFNSSISLNPSSSVLDLGVGLGFIQNSDPAIFTLQSDQTLINNIAQYVNGQLCYPVYTKKINSENVSSGFYTSTTTNISLTAFSLKGCTGSFGGLIGNIYATNTSSVTLSTSNKGALVFTDTSSPNYFDLGYTLSDTFITSSYTACFWLKPTLNPWYRTDKVISLLTDTGNYMHMGATSPSDPTATRTMFYSLEGSTANGSGSMYPNTWYHVTCLQSANARKLYLNGIFDGITTTLPILAYGNRFSTQIGLCDGNVGQISIYNRELTDAEILQNYNATKGRYSVNGITALAGLSTVGSVSDTWPAGYTLCYEVTAVESETIGHFVLYSNSTNNVVVKAYLYSKGSTTPGTDLTGVLLSSTGPITCNGSVGFQPLVAATAANVTVGTKYWIVLAIQSGGPIYYVKTNTSVAVGYTNTADYFTTPFTNPHDATWATYANGGPITGYFTT